MSIFKMPELNASNIIFGLICFIIIVTMLSKITEGAQDWTRPLDYCANGVCDGSLTVLGNFTVTGDYINLTVTDYNVTGDITVTGNVNAGGNVSADYFIGNRLIVDYIEANSLAAIIVNSGFDLGGYDLDANDIVADNDLRCVNDLDVGDDADIGGDLTVVGTTYGSMVGDFIGNFSGNFSGNTSIWSRSGTAVTLTNAGDHLEVNGTYIKSINCSNIYGGNDIDYCTDNSTGGGGFNNPATENLDMNNYNITNVSSTFTKYIRNPANDSYIEMDANGDVVIWL